MIPCINLANHAPEVQIGQILGTFAPIDLYLKKTGKIPWNHEANN